jgi:hypothetical protein
MFRARSFTRERKRSAVVEETESTESAAEAATVRLAEAGPSVSPPSSQPAEIVVSGVLVDGNAAAPHGVVVAHAVVAAPPAHTRL